MTEIKPEFVFGYHPAPAYREALNNAIEQSGFSGAVTADPKTTLRDLYQSQDGTRALVLPMGPIRPVPSPNVVKTQYPVSFFSRVEIATSMPWALIGQPGQDSVKEPLERVPGGSRIIMDEPGDPTAPEQQVATKLAFWLLSLPVLG